MSTEPALILGLVNVLIVAATTFGLPLTQAQAGAINMVAAAVIAVIVRRNVTPVGK